MAMHATGPAIPLGAVFVLLLAFPVIEMAAFVWVAGKIGLLAALAALAATSFLGVALLRRQGVAALGRLAGALRQGEAPRGAARESVMVALGGLLLILPGFVSDAVGLALMAPSLLRSALPRPAGDPLVRREGRRPAADPRGRIVDLDAKEWRSVDP